MPPTPELPPREATRDAATQTNPSMPHNPERLPMEATRDTTALTNPYYLIPRPLPDPQSLTREATEDTTSRRLTRQYSSLVQAATTMLRPEKEVGPSPGTWQSLKSIMLASCKQISLCNQRAHPQIYADVSSGLNLLLLFIPVSVRHRPRIFPQCSHATIVGSPFRLRW